ncbi:MAG: FtsW/RodA/SpoVE family cell cycle protein, partial [Candidatus Krumholzibacteria bacterium]|nr:FtsW/RodA/SpoVE family cell cycle protein [Candidatus Krumholzibacteria bacterium]
DPYSSLLTFGVLGLVATHVVENIGMTVNLMPITGIPLPLFSYGGSFAVVTWLAIAVALRTAWQSRQSGYIDS